MKLSRTCDRAEAHLHEFAELPVLRLGIVAPTSCEVWAILGGAHHGQSFKNLLGLGLITLARERGLLRPGQPVIESSSGSMLDGLALASHVLGHPFIGVTDPCVPWITREKAKMLGARVIEVAEPHPTFGWQQAREDRVRDEIRRCRDLYWTDQNNNPLNPEVYKQWLVPALARRLDPVELTAAVFGVGSGGHFAALSSWIKSSNPRALTYAADRPGSVSFGGSPGPSFVRGVGNTNVVPRVLQTHRLLVDGVVSVTDAEAFAACRDLYKEGIFVGGSSGLAYVAARRIALEIRSGVVLTMFPDRGELYADTIWNDVWMERHGFTS